jgi:Leucine-rich repeat (LRR) protein
MKKIEQILDNLQDVEKVITELGKLDIEPVNKYWMSSALQQPSKGKHSDIADIRRLLLMAFGPKGSMPSLQRFGPRLRTCAKYNKDYRFYQGQQFYDPAGVLTMSTAYQAIPREYFQALFRSLGNVRVRIPHSAFETHFSDGNIDWLIGAKHLELGHQDSESLKALPSDIGVLVGLESIKITYSQITGVPDSLFDLKGLTSIDLSNNKIETLQDGFSRLPNLAFIDISENRLEKIPESIGKHSLLKEFRIHGNPLKEISDEMAFNTYRINRDEEGNPIYYPKDMFVINDTWLGIPPSRLGEIIKKHEIRKLRVESAEMLDRILEPDSARHLTPIRSLDLRWNPWTEFGFVQGWSEEESKYVSDPHNNKARLKCLPKTIKNLPNLEELDLSNNELTELPEELFDLTKLCRLILEASDPDLGKRKSIYSLPDKFDSLKDLQELDLSYHEFSKIPDSLYRLGKLKTLILRSTSLFTLGENLGTLSNLEHIDLSYTNLTNLPKSIVNLRKLKVLKLDYVKIKSFPEKILELSELRVLSMNGVKTKEIPESISMLGKLEELSLKENEISSIPSSIGNLKSLKRLDLEKNDISLINEAIGDCEKLVELNLQSNKKIEGIPLSFGNLKYLETLKLFDCYSLSTLPDVFHELNHLRTLELGSTFGTGKIKDLPDSLYECRSLNKLQIFRMAISRVDKRISNLTNLETLDLRGTQLDSILPEIGRLKKLKKLQLPMLTEPLPESISELSELESLEVNFNGVENPFPKSIAGLKSLSLLKVVARGAKALPDGFKHLHSLKNIDIEDSEMDEIPPEICELGGLLILRLRNNKIAKVPLERCALHSLKVLDLIRNPIAKSATWKNKIKWCLPGTASTIG